MNALLSLLESFITVDKTHLYRKELYFDMLKILRETISTGDSLKNAMIRTRENKRRLGRKMSKNTVGRTVLIKGLEFDHTIILSADYFDEKNLYVALTRASKTVTIISSRNVLLEKK